MARRAKGKPARRPRVTKSAGSRTPTRRSVKRPSKNARPKRKAAGARKSGGKTKAKAASVKKAQLKHPAAKKAAVRSAAPRRAPRPRAPRPADNTSAHAKSPRLDRVRRTLEETVQTPPSSLDMNRRGSAARTGRAEIAERFDEHRGMTSAITGGDADVDVDSAYFTGDEAPGGDNPAPDEEVVDDIGKALGVQYRGQRGAEGQRQDHRARQTPVGNGSRFVRRL